MGHNLYFDKQKGRHAFVTSEGPAWHLLGKSQVGKMNSADCIKDSLLDFTVGKYPIQMALPRINPKEGESDIEIVTIPDKFGTYRTDTNQPFGVVGNIYTVVQNIEAFDFFDAIVGKGEAIYETAGALFNGEKIFITAKLPDHISVGKENVDKYIFLQSTHDGSGSIIAAFTPVRIVCWNTLNMALGNMSNKVSIRHTKDAVAKLREAHKIMGIANKLSIELETIFNVMAKKKIVDADLKKFIEAVVLPPVREQATAEEKAKLSTRSINKINSILSYALSDTTQQTDTTRGTVFGAYNAITGYYQNLKTWNSAEDKINSIINGNAQTVGQKAFDLALELIK